MAKKKKKKSVVGLILLFFWLLFVLIGVVFYFYYWNKLPFNKKSKSKTTTEQQVSVEETTEITTEQLASIEDYVADKSIQNFVEGYYGALKSADCEALKTMVVDSSVYDDSTSVEQKALVLTDYTNIKCYAFPGMTEEYTIVYAMCNLSISGVSSKPLDIQQFYIKTTADGYLINNEELDSEVKSYLEEQVADPLVQELYTSVSDDINECLANDPEFEKFYNMMKQ